MSSDSSSVRPMHGREPLRHSQTDNRFRSTWSMRTSCTAFFTAGFVFVVPASSLGKVPAPLSDAIAMTHEHRATDYELTLETPGTGKVGVGMDFELHLTAKNGKKINFDYPIKLQAVSPEQWDLPPRGHRIEKQGDEGTAAVILAEAKPRRSGKQSFEVRVAFSVCTSDQCLMEKVALSDAVAIE